MQFILQWANRFIEIELACPCMRMVALNYDRNVIPTGLLRWKRDDK